MLRTERLTALDAARGCGGNDTVARLLDRIDGIPNEWEVTYDVSGPPGAVEVFGAWLRGEIVEWLTLYVRAMSVIKCIATVYGVA